MTAIAHEAQQFFDGVPLITQIETQWIRRSIINIHFNSADEVARPLMTALKSVQCATRQQFWIALLVISALSACIFFYKLGTWPWDHDEVPCLVELGILDSPVAQKELGSQLTRLPKLLPVWYGVQQLSLKFFPPNEFGTRVLSALCGLLTVVISFAFGYRWRGLQFAIGLAILLALSQCFVWLSQQNRFYSMAMLCIVISFAMIWTSKPLSLGSGISCVAVALLAVFSHNLAVVVFGIGLISAGICYLLRCIPLSVLLRSALMAAASATVYLFYLRPIMHGWVSGGTGGTNEVVSFAAQLGVPTIALAVLGVGFSLRSRLGASDLLWWTICLVGGVMFIGLSPWLVGNWNPRYALFFMIPFWVMAAFGIEQVAIALKNRERQIAWYGCVALLLLPKLASHFSDGSRHDFRKAASLVDTQIRGGEPVYSNWPETLSYYLHNATKENVGQWPPSAKDKPPDNTSYLIAFASNAFDRFSSPPNTTCDLLGEIATRRFDEQSHVVRIYRIRPRDASPEE
jgi:hypothetical protein